MTEGQKSAMKRRAGKKAAKTQGTQKWLDQRPAGFDGKAFRRSLPLPNKKGSY